MNQGLSSFVDNSFIRKLELFMAAMNGLAERAPKIMEGMDALTTAVGMFNNVVSGKTTQPVVEEASDGFSGFYPYSEQGAAVAELAVEAKRRRLNVDVEQLEKAVTNVIAVENENQEHAEAS
jgi:hypothetical protein